MESVDDGLGREMTMAIGMDELVTRFRDPKPNDEQAARMTNICAACLDLAALIDRTCPDSREKSDALTNLDYVMYQANAAITRRAARP